jgi:hypothetical protein
MHNSPNWISFDPRQVVGYQYGGGRRRIGLWLSVPDVRPYPIPTACTPHVTGIMAFPMRVSLQMNNLIKSTAQKILLLSSCSS